jgi:2,3-diketo-5-methylthiopentyl-1-phosphate enolase
LIDFTKFMLAEQTGEDRLIATYLVYSETDNGLKLAATLASEQTSGTWVEVPGGDEKLLAEHAGQVVAVHEVPSLETSADAGERCFVIQIAYPWGNFGPQLPMLLTTVFGNISMFGRIKLLDIQVPRGLAEALPGPRFGIAGIRKLLGVAERPLLNTMIKPSIGLTPAQGAELLYQAAVGGTDIIKDDEVLADPEVSPFTRRLSVYLEKLEQAEKETGEKKLYAINVTDEPARCLEKAEAAVQAGARAVMINYLPSGLGLVSSLARSPKIDVPILGHLDFGGAIYGSPYHGISSALLYGKLPRLAGIDLLTIPTPYGKFDLSPEKYLGIVMGLRHPLHQVRRTFPIIGGGIKQGDLPRLLQDLGPEFIVGAGGAIYGHPLGPAAGARAFRQGIELLITGGDFLAAEDCPELQGALEKWGGGTANG